MVLKQQQKNSIYESILGKEETYAHYNPKSTFLTREDQGLQRVVIPFTFDHHLGNKLASAFGQKEPEGSLTTSQQNQIRQQTTYINFHKKLGKMYRFVELETENLEEIIFTESGLPNIAFSNIMCFRRIISGKNTLGTSPKAMAQIGNEIFFASAPRFSDRIFQNQNLAKNVILHEIGHAAFGLKHPVQRESTDYPPFLTETDDTLKRSIMVSHGDKIHEKCVQEAALENKIMPDPDGILRTSNYEEFALHCFDRWRGTYSTHDLKAIEANYHRISRVPDKITPQALRDELSSITHYEEKFVESILHTNEPPCHYNPRVYERGIVGHALRDATNYQPINKNPNSLGSQATATCQLGRHDNVGDRIDKGFIQGLKNGIVGAFCQEFCIKLGLEEKDAALASSGLLIALTASNPQIAITAAAIDLSNRYLEDHLDSDRFTQLFIHNGTVPNLTF